MRRALGIIAAGDESSACESSAVSLRAFETTFGIVADESGHPLQQPWDRRTGAREAATRVGRVGGSDPRTRHVSADGGLTGFASGLRWVGPATLRRKPRPRGASLAGQWLAR